MEKSVLKRLCIIILTLSSIFSLANARFFIGIDGGYSMDRIGVKTELEKEFVTNWGTKTNNVFRGNGYLFNLNLGTQHYFDENDLIGFRWLFNLGYGRTDLVYQEDKRAHLPSNIIEATLGADILLDIIKFGNQNSLGVFGGVEGGVLIALSEAKTYDEFPILSAGTLGATARVGLSLFLAQRHRIEFITKTPFYTIWVVSDNRANIYKPIQFMLGYKFVF